MPDVNGSDTVVQFTVVLPQDANAATEQSAIENDVIKTKFTEQSTHDIDLNSVHVKPEPGEWQKLLLDIV